MSSIPLLRFQGLTKSFDGQTILTDLNGEIRRGEVILLRGENASGKTTLINILTGCLEPDRGRIEINATGDATSEVFRFPRPWFRGLNPFRRFTPERVACLGVSRTWQEVRLIPSINLADNIAVAASSSDDSPWMALFHPQQVRRRENSHLAAAHSRLAEFGMIGRDRSSADKISLGQSKRVAIARAVEAGARLLFLDEPLNGLDAAGVADILHHLQEIASNHQITLVMVEHVLNIPRLIKFVTTVWTLRNGTLTIETPASVDKELSCEGLGESIRDVLDRIFGSDSLLTETGLTDDVRLLTYRAQNREPTNDPVVEVVGLVLHRGARRLFGKETAISFRLDADTVNVLEAPNGWGKSSLFECLTGTLRSSAGEVRLFRRLQARDFSPDQFFAAGGRAVPSNSKLFPSITIREVEDLASRDVGSFDSNRRIGSLSGGELRQLILSLVSPARLLIVDEVTNSLDSARIQRMIKQLVREFSHACILFLEPSHVVKSNRQR